MHNHVALTLKTYHALFPPCPNPLQNPRSSPSALNSRSHFSSLLKCSGIEIPPVTKQRLGSLSVGGGSVDDDRVKSVGVKETDVATLGNLCVDIVLNVPKLPPKPLDEREAYMDELSKSPPDKVFELLLLFFFLISGIYISSINLCSCWLFLVGHVLSAIAKHL